MIAHMRKSDYAIQTVQEHLISVSSLAKQYGEKAGFSSTAELAGLLHDMGKNTKAFSVYIENAVKETGAPLERIDHSTAGAKYLYETYFYERPKNTEELASNLTVEIVGMTILSHHSGLQNFMQVDGSESDFFRRVCREDLPYYEEVCEEFLSIPGNEKKVEVLFEAACKEMSSYLEGTRELLKAYGENRGEISHHIFFGLALKFVFSCLIDGDRTDSRRFDENDTSELHQANKQFFEDSYTYLIEYLNGLAEKPAAGNPINQLRAKMSERCDRLAEEPSAIYQLSIPTGGGKTLASLRYALKHAKEQGKERIIYVVPYTTILEQNADAVREIIKNEEMVLEHHANIIDDSGMDDVLDHYQKLSQKKMQLARDNWDHPIIFTTMVQFLDTFYAKGTRKARRLHNLTNAIVIFDEVQSVPVKHIPLFNSTVNFLHYFGGSSIILCTATQPSFAKTKYPLLVKENIEMIKDLPAVVKAFERVSIKNKITKEGWEAEEIANFSEEILEDKASVLIILNTKKAVLNVFEQLKDKENYHVYHLSTSMCPQHRKDILDKVRGILEENEKRRESGEAEQKIVCISTQLIEAGVDISFQCVIRSLAGLDSIAQAAGRCNRNGEHERGIVYVIKAKDESLSKLEEIKLGQKVTLQDVLSREELVQDLLSPEAIQTYFDFYLKKAEREIQLEDKKLKVELVELLNYARKYYSEIPSTRPRTAMRTMYKTIESNFEVIEAHTTGILVPYNDRGKGLIASLNEEVTDYNKLNQLLKEAQLYSINVYSHTLRELVGEDLIYPLYTEGVFALQDSGYHKAYGLSLEGEGQWDLPIF